MYDSQQSVTVFVRPVKRAMTITNVTYFDDRTPGLLLERLRASPLVLTPGNL